MNSTPTFDGNIFTPFTKRRAAEPKKKVIAIVHERGGIMIALIVFIHVYYTERNDGSIIKHKVDWRHTTHIYGTMADK